MRKPWTPQEIRDFLHLNTFGRTVDIAWTLKRSIPAIMHMRRKLKRLNDLHVSPPDLPAFLTVSNAFVETHTLMQIRRRSTMDVVPTAGSLRRAKHTGKPHLVAPYKRNRVLT